MAINAVVISVWVLLVWFLYTEQSRQMKKIEEMISNIELILLGKFDEMVKKIVKKGEIKNDRINN